MASCSGNGSRGHHRFTLNVNETSVNTTNNTSTVSWSLVLSPIQTGWDWNISGISYSVSVDGGVASGNIQSYNGSSTVTIASGSKTITHNSDGSKSIGFSFNITDSANKTYTPGNASGSGSMTLTKINRKANITSANNFTDEENPSMNFSNPGGYTMNAWLEPNPNGEHLCVRNNIANTGNYTWTLTTEERNQLRQACTGKSCTIRYGIYTIIGGSSYSSYIDKTMTIVNGNPIFEDFEYEDTNASVTAITGDDQVIVKGLSNLQITIPVADKMEALKYATEVKYIANIDTLTGTVNYSDNDDVTIDLGVVASFGEKNLNVNAYDSRNYFTTVTKSINVYDYTEPTINLEASRLNNFEDTTTIKVDGSFSLLTIENQNKNQINYVKYRYRETESQNWSSYQNAIFTTSNDNYTCDDIVLTLDSTKQFEVEIQVIDNFSTVTRSINVDVGVPLFFISTDGEAFVGEDRVLTEADIEDITKDVYSSAEVKTNKVYIDSNDYEWPIYRKFFTGNAAQNAVVSLATISDLKFITSIKGTAQSNYNWTWNIPNGSPSGYEVQVRMQTSTKEIQMTFGDYFRTANTFWCTIEYTKTTDAPASI